MNVLIDLKNCSLAHLWERGRERGATHVDMPPTKVKRAFTLAEVLITLGIIGVVAAMTIPSLMTKIQDKQFKVKYKESISIVSQAMKSVYAESEETYTSTSWIQMPVYLCKLQKHLKVMYSGIDCTKVNEDSYYTANSEWPLMSKNLYVNTWHSKNWYDKDGNSQKINNGYSPLSIDLINGVRLFYTCGNQLFVDVNGEDGPNVIGRDIYVMFFSEGVTSPEVGFGKFRAMKPNDCSIQAGNATPTLTKDNYVEDCLHGSGWGCSFIH